MKQTKIRFGTVLLGCFVLFAGLTGCQSDPSDETIDKTAERFVDALMSNPRYLEYLNSDETVDRIAERFVNAMMSEVPFRSG